MARQLSLQEGEIIRPHRLYANPAIKIVLINFCRNLQHRDGLFQHFLI
jgi:hypothetical protein